MQHEHRQEGTLPQPTEIQRVVCAETHLKRSEDPEFQAGPRSLNANTPINWLYIAQ